MARNLTKKQRKFVNEYADTGNGSLSVKEAGYAVWSMSDRGAGVHNTEPREANSERPQGGAAGEMKKFFNVGRFIADVQEDQ